MESGGTIFGLLNGELVEMNEGAYLSEDELQEYLEKHANLLAGEQIDRVSPRRWLLVAREMKVPDKVDGKSRWSLDHLFVDQDATPALVEVKRSTNTEIRRQIVGQMLDYAANGSEYWTIGQIREEFAKTCVKNGKDENNVFRDFLEDVSADTPDASLIERIQDFWKLVDENLKTGNVRLLFVADVIPDELRRIIAFLNVQMSPAQVLGVEIRQYKAANITAFVPRVFPQITAASERKPPSRTQTGASASDVVPTLIRSNRIPKNAVLQFRPERGEKKAIQDWMTSQSPDILQAEWQADANRTLKWRKDGNLYSATGLSRIIYSLAGQPSDAIRGTACWTYEGKTLVELALDL